MPATPQKVGIMHSGSNNGKHDDHIKAFKKSLSLTASNFTYVNNGNPHYANDDPKTLQTHANNLVNAVDVLVAAGGTASAQAAKAAAAMAGNTAVKIVFTSVTDPVRSGLVTNLAKPEGNLTGICTLTSELDPERLKKLTQIQSPPTIIGVLLNAVRPNVDAQYITLQGQAAALNNLTLVPVKIDPTKGQIDKDINAAFTYFATQKVQAVLVTADPLFNDYSDTVLKAVNKFPAIYQWREFADAGGLMSYGTSLMLAYVLAGDYAGRIVNGALPQFLPVLTIPSELILNLKTASAINIGFSDPLLTSANEVIV